MKIQGKEMDFGQFKLLDKKVEDEGYEWMRKKKIGGRV